MSPQENTHGELPPEDPDAAVEAAASREAVEAPAPGTDASDPGPAAATVGRVSFVGAGPGAPDLLTLRAARLIGEADVVVWARSLVSPEVLVHARDDAEVLASDELTLEQVVERVYAPAAREGRHVVRLQSGDPSVYAAIGEQLRACRDLGLACEIVPGVGSLSATAAALGQELTIPEVSQSIILTRRAVRTPMPDHEDLKALAAHGVTMALYLSVRRPRELQADLLEGGYAPDTPCVIAYRASWPDELVLRCPLSELAAELKAHRITTQALVLLGPALREDDAGGRSHVYRPDYGHRYRRLGRPDRYRTPAQRTDDDARAAAERSADDARGAAGRTASERDGVGERSRTDAAGAASRRREDRERDDRAGAGGDGASDDDADRP